MDSVFAMLKQAREAKGLSLTDVADATFIGVRYLEAIEAGKTDILPQAYVRAFIREYAAVVGLNAAEVMRLYDSPPAPRKVPVPAHAGTDVSTVAERPAQDLSEAAPVAREAPTAEIPPPSPAPPPPPPPPPAPRRDLTDMIQKAAVVMGVIVIAVVLWNVMGIEKPKPREIPFQSVIQENEQHATGPARKDSTRAAGAQGARVDSLTLQAQTSDSVWVQIIVDDGTPREYLFRPNARASWKAAEKFVLTIGNAGAVRLTLNKKDLGPLGKQGAVIQKLELTRQSLSR
jgi:cytoskeletal protein RodZ